MTDSGGPDNERDPKLLCDPAHKEELENRNAVDQIDYITYLVDELEVQEVRESHIVELQKLAIQGIYPCAGHYRDALKRVYIQNSEHTVPDAAAIPGLVHEALSWINDMRGQRSALERAAYSLWRFNWIHPFSGGNGRTSRAIAYLIVCAENGAMLPGDTAMPDLILERRDEYIRALQEVDRSARERSDDPDFGAMTKLLQEILTRQLASAINKLSQAPKPRP
ncbi:MAG TPA: Fic family protein [Polyangiaceae bacterium]|nr:Fic family protein [Polyangiaceae bacterium]